MRIFSMYLFWRLVKARDFKIKHTQEPGLNMRKKLFIEFQKIFWSETITKAEKNLLKALYICICERLFSIKENSCVELRFFWERAWIRRLEGIYTSFYCSPNVFPMRLFQWAKWALFQFQKKDSSTRIIFILGYIRLNIFTRICWKHGSLLNVNSATDDLITIGRKFHTKIFLRTPSGRYIR